MIPSKERLEKIASWRETYGSDRNVMLPAEEAEAMARQLLAVMEQEPVGEVVLGDYDDCGDYPDAKVVCIAEQGQADWNNFSNGARLYAAPQLPQLAVVPDAISTRQEMSKMEECEPCDSINVAYKYGWNACRAAMLQGKAEPLYESEPRARIEATGITIKRINDEA